MNKLNRLKRSYLFAFFCAMVGLAVPAAAAPVFQMRLVLADGPQSEPPKDTERMVLTATNSANGKIQTEIFWVSKDVVMDQSDLQATRVVTSTAATSNLPGEPVIDVAFTPKGRKRFAELTRRSIDKRLAIIIDGRLVSAPVIRSEISGGKAMITGHFTQSEAEELSEKINRSLNK